MSTLARLPWVVGGWPTLMIDPPWPFEDQGSRLGTPYGAMTEAEILAMPIPALAAPSAHVYLWTTDAHLHTACAALFNWGLNIASTLVWRKVDASGRPRLGGGHYLRHAHETCILGVRGSLKALSRDVPSIFDAPRGAHSEKPAEAYAVAARVSPGPRLALFERQQRPGWVCYGDELGIAVRSKPEMQP